ncbi:MAG: histidinol-phosphatase [Alphaproteobacteria bacterium]|nr:histidinol-phosphatase [Alphaproteobacteria bacterium]
MGLFRSAMDIENKLDEGFDPVTEADRLAEQTIRQIISARYPDHSIIGEELTDTITNSPFTWVIDPIDGTRSFICGLPLWGTLVGLMHNGRAFAGFMDQPHIGETFIAASGNAWLEHKDARTVLKTSKVTALAEARLLTTSPDLFEPRRSRPAYAAVERQCRLARYGTDCYGYCLLAGGHVDLVVEEGLKPVDITALVPIVEMAGGVITSWSGGRVEGGGQAVAAATPELHAAALGLLAPAASPG